MLFLSGVGARYAYKTALEVHPKLLPSVVVVQIPMGFIYDELVHTREYQHIEYQRSDYIPDASPNETWNYSFDGQYMWYALPRELMKGGYAVRVPITSHPRETLPVSLQIYGGIEYDWELDMRGRMITFFPHLQVWKIAPAGLMIAVALTGAAWILGVIVIGLYAYFVNVIRPMVRRRATWHTTIAT